MGVEVLPFNHGSYFMKNIVIPEFKSKVSQNCLMIQPTLGSSNLFDKSFSSVCKTLKYKLGKKYEDKHITDNKYLIQ